MLVQRYINDVRQYIIDELNTFMNYTFNSMLVNQCWYINKLLSCFISLVVSRVHVLYHRIICFRMVPKVQFNPILTDYLIRETSSIHVCYEFNFQPKLLHIHVYSYHVKITCFCLLLVKHHIVCNLKDLEFCDVFCSKSRRMLLTCVFIVFF